MIAEELRRYYLDAMGIQVWRLREGSLLSEDVASEGLSDECPLSISDASVRAGISEAAVKPADPGHRLVETVDAPRLPEPVNRSSARPKGLAAPPLAESVSSSTEAFRLLLVSIEDALVIADLPVDPASGESDALLADRTRRFIANLVFASVGKRARGEHYQEFCWPPSSQTPKADRSLAVAVQALALPLQRMLTASPPKMLLIMGEWSARCCGAACGPEEVKRQRLQLTENHQADGIIAPAFPVFVRQPQLKKRLWQHFSQPAGN